MNIAIAGAGIAGGYLAALLGKEGIAADLYDGWTHGTACGFRSCGWGVPAAIGPYLTRIGLDPGDYLLEPMSPMNFDELTARTPLVTVDKPRLIRDLSRDAGLIRQDFDPERGEEYDLVVDATGIRRSLLPPCRSDLTLPTLQYRVIAESGCGNRPDIGVYGNRISGLGYIWVFPLGDRHYHIGVGGIGLPPLEIVLGDYLRELAGRFSLTALCSCRDVIRVASPYYSTPFYTQTPGRDGPSRTVVGVGESIGTVGPFTGEGIVPSMECARILAATLDDPGRYTGQVLSRFAWMRRERETIDYLRSGSGTAGPRLRDRWRFYRNARRSGIGLPLPEAFRRMGSLSQWIG